MNFIKYTAAAVLGLLCSYIGLVFAMLSDIAYIIGVLLALAYACMIFYVVKKGPESAFALALPMFLVMGVLQVFLIGKYVFTQLIPDSKEFTFECRTTGAQFTKLPISPVHSIAYDWDAKNAPTVNQFQVIFGTRITSLGRSFDHVPNIEFIERKRSDLEGRPSQGPDEPYVRLPKVGAYYGIPALTADVLVYYRVTPEKELEKAVSYQGIVRYEITVTDRRTTEKLASLSYIVDAKQSRGCGLTGDNTMNVQSFVLKAIGK